MLKELKQRMSEGMMEGAKQQAANLLVKKEKVLELAAETFSSSEITPLLEKTTDESQVRGAHQDLGIFFFLGFAILMLLGVGLLRSRVIRSEAARRTLRRTPGLS